MYVTGVLFGFAWRWIVFYAIMCFVTQLWAGSSFSPGQGGGLIELVLWSSVFGLVALGVILERLLNGHRVIVPQRAFRAAVIGHVVGASGAAVWFTMKDGPSQGDWWAAPAVATVVAALYVHFMAPKIDPAEFDDLE